MAGGKAGYMVQVWEEVDGVVEGPGKFRQREEIRTCEISLMMDEVEKFWELGRRKRGRQNNGYTEL